VGNIALKILSLLKNEQINTILKNKEGHYMKLPECMSRVLTFPKNYSFVIIIKYIINILSNTQNNIKET
jgi:hypothetical protein